MARLITCLMGDKYEMTITNYDDIRELLSTKVMREIHLKK